MKKKYFLFFIFIYILVTIFSKNLIDEYDDKNKALKRGLDDVKYKKTVIFGDSHSAYGIKNKYLSKNYYNFSYPGESIIASRIKLNKILSQDSLSMVVLTISPHNVGKRRFSISSFFHFYPLFSIKEINNNKNISLTDNLKILLAYFFPYSINEYRVLLQKYLIDVVLFQRNIRDYKDFYYDDFNDLNQKNGSWVDFSNQNKINRAKKRYKKMNKGGLSLDLINEYNYFVQSVKQKNIKIVALVMPLSNEFINITEQDSVWEKVLSDFKNMDFDYIIDKKNYFSSRQEYFLNQDHLNRQGSEVFSKSLKKELDLIHTD